MKIAPNVWAEHLKGRDLLEDGRLSEGIVKEGRVCTGFIRIRIATGSTFM
jgi:hypothetical protein